MVGLSIDQRHTVGYQLIVTLRKEMSRISRNIGNVDYDCIAEMELLKLELLAVTEATVLIIDKMNADTGAKLKSQS